MLQNFRQLINDFGELVGLLIPILIAVAVLVFIFGVVKFIVNAGDPEKRKEGGKFMIFSILGIFVIVSLFGLVNLLQEAFGVDNKNEIDRRDVPTINADNVLQGSGA